MQALEEHGIPPIQMVVVNLYQFEKIAAKPGVTREELIENIDIGGPTMIRAAAKNFQDVAVVVSPDQYEQLMTELKTGELSAATHWRLAQEAFLHTAAYDRAVSRRLLAVDTPAAALPEPLDISAAPCGGSSLRRKSAPAGRALHTREAGIAAAEQLHGKELSYNNLVDLDAAWQLIQEFEGTAAAIIKHTNPCGCAEQATLKNAYLKALEADPVSAFGGVLAFNRELDEDTAGEVSKLFVEAIAAPAFSEESLDDLASQEKSASGAGNADDPTGANDSNSISGGLLAQTADTASPEISIKSARQPTAEEMRALLFGWKVCKHVKSNAIVYARDGQTISVGAGQMSRVDSVKVGAMKAVLPLAGSVVASDAFFPFPDGVEEAAKHGVTAFIQPGGSVKDAEVIAAADRLGLAMVFTGVRHFRH